MKTSDYLNPDILKPLEDDSKSLGEKLFSISKYFSPFLYNSMERDPNDLEKHEALIFACFWTLRIVITSYKLPSETQSQLLTQIYIDADVDMKEKVILCQEGLNLYKNRIQFYLSETKKMNSSDYNYLPILDKLYFNPLSDSYKILAKPNPIEYLNLASVFSIGIKKYDELVKETIDSLKNTTELEASMENYTSEEIDIIKKLQKQLYDESELLHSVSTSLQEDLHNNDAEAHEILNTALRHATHQFKEIGYELNAYGGFELMQSSINKISKAGFSITPIDHAWDGIGQWVV